MSTVTSSLISDPLKDIECGPENYKDSYFIILFSIILPVNLPQRVSKFPLLPLTDLHNVELNGSSLKSSLNSSIAESGQHAGPEAPEMQLQTKQNR